MGTAGDEEEVEEEEEADEDDKDGEEDDEQLQLAPHLEQSGDRGDLSEGGKSE